MAEDKKSVCIKTKIPAKPFVASLEDFLNELSVNKENLVQYLSGYFTGDYCRHLSELHIIAAIENSPITQFLKENISYFKEAISNHKAANYICFALLCGRYSFCYDIAVALASQFRLQDEVSKELLVSIVSRKYGYNENVKRASERFVFFMEDAGIITRPNKQTYILSEPLKPVAIVEQLWKECYYQNQPLANREDESELPFEPFFRYLNLLPDLL